MRNNPVGRYYMVIEYNVERVPGVPARVRGLFSTVNDVTLWLGTSETKTEAHYLMESKIVHRYGMPRNEDDLDAFLEDYSKRFPPLPTLLETMRVKDVDGWLSPDAVFYACGFMGHSSLAVDLACAFYVKEDYGDIGPDDDILYQNGWVMISHGNVQHGSYYWLVDPPVPMREAQKTWLRHLADANKSTMPNYAKEIDNCIERSKRADKQEEMSR